MSTTARIAVKTANQTILFNKYHDGYPSRVEAVLLTFLHDVIMNGMPITAEEIETRLNKADYPDEKGYRPDIDLYAVTDRKPITILRMDDDADMEYYYTVDLTDVTKQEPGTETPDQAASRFWDANATEAHERKAREKAEEERDRAREELAQAREEAEIAINAGMDADARTEELKKALEAVEASRDQARAEASEARKKALEALEALVLLINHLTKNPIGQTNP